MLPINPPLAALHGQRLDHHRAIARDALDAAEHLTAGMIQWHASIIDRLARTSDERTHVVPSLAALDLATDPQVQRLGTDLLKTHARLMADMGTRWIAMGEWHQHGINALWSQWLDQFERHSAGMPFASGVGVLQKIVESSDHAVSDAAGVAVQATEVVTEQVERAEAAVTPGRRNAKN